MNVQIAEFIEKTGLKEPLYPGKKIVQVAASGEFKSHCIVYDWREPERLKIEIKAGTTGRNLPLNELKNYPVSFQAPTHVIIEIDGEDESEGAAEGSGSRSPKKAQSGFAKVAEGKMKAVGKIAEMVVMGKEIATEAFETVFKSFEQQIEKMKISPTNLLAKAGNYVTRYTPPAFMQPKGNEQAQYTYNRDKAGPMFGISPG